MPIPMVVVARGTGQADWRQRQAYIVCLDTVLTDISNGLYPYIQPQRDIQTKRGLNVR